MSLVCLVAMAENGVIGRDNQLPWHLPDDLKRFKQLTMGHTLVMGRKTFQSIGRPLPGRQSIVLSADPAFTAEGVTVVRSWDEALAVLPEQETAFVIGGASLYRLALPQSDVLHLTLVHAVVEGDVRFPLEEMWRWRLREEDFHPADARHEHAFSFRTYRRR